MDTLDHRKDHTQGHDNHGVHVCHKCGWPFPNPHPSAKHRRAHKKICGTIEGFKLISSEGSTHSTVSDDEHHSDGDYETPSPRVLERSNEKGSGAIGDRSGRSEDEVFSDAVAEFPDSGSGKRIEESPDDVKKQSTLTANIVDNVTRTTLSFVDTSVIASTPPPSNSADSSHLQITDVLGSNLSGSARDSQNHVPSAAVDFMERSFSGYRTEESMYESSDAKGDFTFDSNPMQFETQLDALQKNHEKTAGVKVVETDAKGSEETQNKMNDSSDGFIETNRKAHGKTDLDGPLADVEVSPNDNVGEASEAVSKLGKAEDETSDLVPNAGAIHLTEQFNDKLDPDISLSGYSPEAESVEHMSSCIHTSQIKVEAIQGADLGGSGNLIEITTGEEKGCKNVHVLSVPGDILVVENAEAMIRGYKDHKGGRLTQLVDVGSLELSNQVNESVLEDNASNICSGQSNEGTEVSVFDMHVLEDNLEQTGENKEHIVEKFLDGTEHDMSQVKVTINEIQRTEEVNAHAYVPNSEIERSCTAQCPEEQLPDVDSSPHAGSLEQATNVVIDKIPTAAPMDAEVGHITNLVGVNDPGDDETSRVEKCGKAENESARIKKEDSSMENIIAISEVGKVESYHASETEHREGDSTLGSMEGNHMVKTLMPESANDLQENYVVSENKINPFERNLSEPERLHLSSASDSKDGVKELEGNGNGNGTVHEENAASVSAAAESDNSGELQKSSDNVREVDLLLKPLNNINDVEVLQKPSDNIDDVEALQKSSEKHVSKVPQLSSLDTSSNQNCATVRDNSAGDFTGVASDNQSESFRDEGENKSITQQLGASATDLSVDSGSQTDSLEGHWGSVSVISTQSDMPTIVDTDTLASNGSKASAVVEKTELKKPKAFPEGQQHSDKSDIFEPPSFMTLVEPRGGTNATTTEIQTVQNMQQPQAGWFPVLTHVVNESQGRKKNQEIIAKVTNWSTGKQHTPLKNLLGEANAETKLKFPNTKENPVAQVVQKDETKIKDNSSSPTTVSSVLGSQMPVAESVNKDASKEWNSPARYPADIKREKRKVKGRPYWAQFVCCSSVN